MGALIAGSALAADAGVPIRIDDEPRIKIRGCKTRGSARTARIKGLITDYDGRPIGGAKVYAYATTDDAEDVSVGFATVSSGADGIYEVPVKAREREQSLSLKVDRGPPFAFPHFRIPRGCVELTVDLVVAPAGTR